MADEIEYKLFTDLVEERACLCDLFSYDKDKKGQKHIRKLKNKSSTTVATLPAETENNSPFVARGVVIRFDNMKWFQQYRHKDLLCSRHSSTKISVEEKS